MNRCWKCGQELPEGASLCHACGADQQDRAPLPALCSEEARAMRTIYDHYGCRQVLGNATLLHNALGDFLGEDGRKLRNQVHIAMDSGLGKLYLSQLEHPTPQFSAQALNLLTHHSVIRFKLHLIFGSPKYSKCAVDNLVKGR